MKKIILFSVSLIVILGTESCQKIKYPVKIVTELDTTLFTDGQFAEYPWPIFDANSNEKRNALLEDYTGHKCPNCPVAAKVATDIEAANTNRVFVVSMHTSNGGDGPFQDIGLDCSDPTNDYCHDFRTNEGNDYGIKFDGGFNFGFNPMGNINRKSYGNDMFFKKNFWAQKVDDMLVENDLKVNIQAKSNYYAASKGVYLHVKTDFLEDLLGDYSIVTYVIQNSIIADQDSLGVHLHHYHHHNVFLGCIDGEAWGHAVGGTDPVSGSVESTDYSYVIPTGIESDDIHFLTYVYNTANYEILQVIKHEL